MFFLFIKRNLSQWVIPRVMFVLLAAMYDEDILIVYVINFKKSAFIADFIMTVSLM